MWEPGYKKDNCIPQKLAMLLVYKAQDRDLLAWADLQGWH